jgi:hypothetical protein
LKGLFKVLVCQTLIGVVENFEDFKLVECLDLFFNLESL